MRVPVTDTVHQHALHLATAHGVRVGRAIPPGADSDGKRPKGRWLHGRPGERASTDRDFIDDWFADESWNSLVVCGETICVLDIDPGKSDFAPKSLEQIADLFGEEVLKTFRVRTPSGGWHFYFAVPKDGGIVQTNHSGWVDGVDWQSKGSYVIGPGSAAVSKTGEIGAYEVEFPGEILETPQILRDTGLWDLVGKKMKECEVANRAGRGRRAALNSLGFTAGGLVGANRLSLSLADAITGRAKALMQGGGCRSSDVDEIVRISLRDGERKPLERLSPTPNEERQATRADLVEPAIMQAALRPRSGRSAQSDRSVELSHLLVAHLAGDAEHYLSRRDLLLRAGLASGKAVSAARDRLIDEGRLQKIAKGDRRAYRSGRAGDADCWRVLPPDLPTMPWHVGMAYVWAPLANTVFGMAARLSHDLFRRSAAGPWAHHILCVLASTPVPMSIRELEEATGYRQGLARSDSGKRGPLVRLAEADLVVEHDDGLWSLNFDIGSIDRVLDEAAIAWDEGSMTNIAGKRDAKAIIYASERSGFIGEDTPARIHDAALDDARWVGSAFQLLDDNPSDVRDTAHATDQIPRSRSVTDRVVEHAQSCARCQLPMQERRRAESHHCSATCRTASERLRKKEAS